MTNIVKHESQITGLSVFSNAESFEHAQRIAKMLASSDLVPSDYKGNMANTLVALEMANRIGASPLAVMQNMNVIEGRPSWGSSFVIAALNSCGRFAPIRFKVEDLGEREFAYDVWEGPKGQRTKRMVKEKMRNFACTAWTKDASGEVLEGPTVTMEMAVVEGWYGKPGSKWKTMPQLMLRYRSAKFFGNLYAPDVLMGMQTTDEAYDISENPSVVVTPTTSAAAPASNPIAELNSEGAAKPTRKRVASKPAAPEIIDTPSEEVSSTPATAEPLAPNPSEEELM